MAWNDIALQALRHAVEQQQPSGLREALAEVMRIQYKELEHP